MYDYLVILKEKSPKSIQLFMAKYNLINVNQWHDSLTFSHSDKFDIRFQYDDKIEYFKFWYRS